MPSVEVGYRVLTFTPCPEGIKTMFWNVYLVPIDTHAETPETFPFRHNSMV
jgi:hypothetical protein